jgi:hypothetical protein
MASNTPDPRRSGPGRGRDLNNAETAALLAANESGQIVIPPGSAMEIESLLKVLLRLEKAGLVRRNDGSAFYRPFALTEQGIAVKKHLSESPQKASGQ